ncbi:MAG TPA: methyltransferase domain-containing protein [Desulfuromonadales bacterium]|nr:methyltransferase domain-containing protein [Desulfuromonadales bacterium]
MFDSVRHHYQIYPYPSYPLLASVRLCDTYALNLDALWSRFNGRLPPRHTRRILLAGCGTFSPYPWAVANPAATVTALDLSDRSLKRAHLHCLLHGRTHVEYRCGDLLDPVVLSGTYAAIDSYGVLHHLQNPLEGLKALEKSLIPGGILRIMVYSRYARRSEESIRRAFRLIGVRTPQQAKSLMRRASPDSRLAEYAAGSDEMQSLSGIADALFHPCVHTYRIDELLAMIALTSLQPLLFSHRDADENVNNELNRLRDLEKERRSPGNFILYLRKDGMPESLAGEPVIMLNPCLRQAVSPLTLGTVRIAPRMGRETPSLGSRERKFLRRFVKPVPARVMGFDDVERVAVYKRALFLLEYRP